jgi:hypothetical protein
LIFYKTTDIFIIVFTLHQEKHEYFHHLNDEVRTMILQLQSNNKEHLTAADVEAIVYRIIGKETAELKANIAGINSEAQLQQVGILVLTNN